MNSRTPASRWRRLLKLKQININSFKIIIGLFFTPTTILSNKCRHFVCLLLHDLPFQMQITTADQLVFAVLPWVNFVLPWVKCVVPWLFVLPWQLWATASNKLYWIEDQLADVSTRFYTSASWTVGDMTGYRCMSRLNMSSTSSAGTYGLCPRVPVHKGTKH